MQKSYYLTIFVVLMGLLWPATLLAQDEVTCASDYTVQTGDFLTRIAADTLDNSKLYPAIIAATNSKAATDNSYAVIGQDNVIQEGWKLCIPSDADAPGLLGSATTPAANPNSLSADALANATYSGIYDTPITLTDGTYEGEPFSADSPLRPRVTLINNGTLFGDLDGDGVDDAVVFLVENSGGTGNFVYVAAQLNQNGQPLDAGAIWIEDRIQIKSAAIENGQIKLEITAEGPGDAACCKSHKTRKTYTLQNGKLAEVAGPEEPLEQISAADLNGTTWTLVDLNFDQQPALADAPITVSFQDGQISGSGGCNTYNGSFTLGADNPFVMTVSPVAATKVACPDPILNQETTYFAALEHVSQWGYLIGQLTLSYDNGQGGLNTLVFAPQTAPPALTAEQLNNATYSGIYEDTAVTLIDGKYEGEPFSADSPLRPTVMLLDNGIIFGDLNSDGIDDAVVFPVENSGGTGQFVYASAQLNQNGQPLDAGIVAMGDRIAIKSAAIENNQVVVEIITQGPGDGACCPTLKVRATYALQDGKLAEVSSEELGKISAADLNGTTWTLVDLNFDQQPPLANTPVTISFQDGQISGSGGCNSYNGSFTLAEENPFGLSIGPVAATQKACPDPILNQETTYFSALEKASQWGYRVGRLAIYYSNDQNGLGTLLFTPATAASPVETLTGSTWQWIRLTDPQQQVEVILPENYTLIFMSDGTLQIKADCNQATASYTAGEDGALSVTPGVTTLAACPPGSRGEELIQKLGFAAIYFFQNGNLFIDLMADGGTLEFSPRAEMAAANTFIYQCEEGKSFTAEFTGEGPDGSVNLTLDGQTLTLPRVPSGSGAKYSDDQTTLWTQGDEGFIEVGGEMTYQNCTSQVN